ncbi:MAG: PKD domain-containing protein [Pseudomonadota bacterium]|nr:PKD domain-containing protein [Pseudomonadota bacterium]
MGAAHDVLRFDVSDVRDPDGHGVEISWQFGDGAGGYGAVTRHAYGAPGTYTATVTARDSTGLACGVSTGSLQVLAVSRSEGN